MQHTILNHPKIKVDRRTGEEGPVHDPYHYDEITVDNGVCKIMIHSGLAQYVQVNGHVFDAAVHGHYDDDDWMSSFVEEITGYRLTNLIKWGEKAKNRCRMGGYHDTYSVRGHPGETFLVCKRCGEYADCFFSESAIM